LQCFGGGGFKKGEVGRNTSSKKTSQFDLIKNRQKTHISGDYLTQKSYLRGLFATCRLTMQDTVMQITPNYQKHSKVLITRKEQQATTMEHKTKECAETTKNFPLIL